MADEEVPDHEKTVGPDINEAGEEELKRREELAAGKGEGSGDLTVHPAEEHSKRGSKKDE